MPGMIVLVVAVIVPCMRVEVWQGRRRRRIRYRLIVPVRRIEVWGTRVSWVVAKRNALEIAGGASDVVGLAEGNVVWRLAFEDEVCRLFGR